MILSSFKMTIAVRNNADSRPITRKLFSAWHRRRKHKDKYLVDIPEDLAFHLGQIRRFSRHELRVATENFSDKNTIQYGKIYKGRLAYGSAVAVKRCVTDLQAPEFRFQREVEINSITSHQNVLHVLGFCFTKKEQLLVYPLMANGSVASCLRGRHESRPSIDWPIRKRIALGTAKGLAYLHHKCHKKIVHRDIKGANIFLDEDFEAIIGDFKSAIVMEHNVTYVTTSTITGTNGYMAPEYLVNGVCSEKTDVFAYGMFLLELVTGKRVYDLASLAHNEGVRLQDWVKRNFEERKLEVMADADCGGDYMEEVVEQLLQIALLCTQTTPEGRPKMSDVVRTMDVGESLAERWIELCRVGFEREHYNYQISDCILEPEELSGPR